MNPVGKADNPLALAKIALAQAKVGSPAEALTGVADILIEAGNPDQARNTIEKALASARAFPVYSGAYPSAAK
jgi:Flp pilus assembly protein TadD